MIFSIIFWIVFFIAFVLLFLLAFSPNLLRIDPSLTPYSFIKDAFSILITLIGNKLAAEWKEQTVFPAKNKTAISLNVSLNQFRNIFEHNFRSNINNFSKLLALSIKMRKQNKSRPIDLKALPPYEITSYQVLHEKIRLLINSIYKCMNNIEEVLYEYTKQTEQSFILKEKNIIKSTEKINKIISEYLFHFSVFSNHPFVNLNDDLNFLQDIFSENDFFAYYSQKNLNQSLEEILNVLQIQEEILEKYY